SRAKASPSCATTASMPQRCACASSSGPSSIASPWPSPSNSSPMSSSTPARWSSPAAEAARGRPERNGPPMNREFLDLYNRELQLLNEHAREFAEEYPGIAERLGGLVAERADPMVAGLLEGAAFLAARVQLKLKHEFPEFTNNLIEQLVPNYLAPTPSAMLAKIVPPYSDPALRDGSRIRRGASLDATYRERDRRVTCRYRLAADVTLWPFDVAAAEYIANPARLPARGAPVGAGVAAGLRPTLPHRR